MLLLTHPAMDTIRSFITKARAYDTYVGYIRDRSVPEENLSAHALIIVSIKSVEWPYGIRHDTALFSVLVHPDCVHEVTLSQIRQSVDALVRTEYAPLPVLQALSPIVADIDAAPALIECHHLGVTEGAVYVH